MDIQVNIVTYNRPAPLRRLLLDLQRERPPGVRVSVFDDGSTADYVEAASLLRNSDEFIRFEHHGKRRWWKLLGQVHRHMRGRRARYFVTLDDDVRLCRRFFERAISLWESVDDGRKVALTLHRDHRGACWGSPPPVNMGNVRLLGWLECAFITRIGYYAALGFTGVPVHRPWSQQPDLGSGAYKAISERLRRRRRTIYGTSEALVVHADDSSVMNPEARTSRPLRTVNFVDGFAEQRRLEAESGVLHPSTKTATE